jgi:ribA/ribD-fused uncharacterized protein
MAETLYNIGDTSYFYFYQGVFSNFSKVSFNAVINNIEYEFCCGEQYIMARKAKLMGDDASFIAIMKSKSPKVIKMLGRKVAPWNQNLWDENVKDVAYQLCLSRCVQDMKLTTLGNTLLDERRACKKLIVVEASPTDAIWGSGQSAYLSHLTMLTHGTYQGINILGESFSRVADELFDELN